MGYDLAPIVLLTYNRPEHTKKTIEALLNNKLAEQSVLFVYSDGARTDEDVKKVDAVRNYISSISGFKEVRLIKRQENYGLGRNIIQSITEVINIYEKVIVLEDDIVTSPFFLDYMNRALDKYINEQAVMQISGYTEPFKKRGLPDTFFMSWPDCLGWATWKRVWDLYERDPERIVNEYTKEDIKFLNINGSAPTMWNQIIRNQKGEIYTWAIFFHAMVCEHRGLTLYSKESLTQHIGNDGSGENCGVTEIFDVNVRHTQVGVLPTRIALCRKAEKHFIDYNNKIYRGSRIRRFIRFIRKSLLGETFRYL